MLMSRGEVLCLACLFIVQQITNRLHTKKRVTLGGRLWSEQSYKKIKVCERNWVPIEGGKNGCAWLT